jgi:hypothetical protein
MRDRVRRARQTNESGAADDKRRPRSRKGGAKLRRRRQSARVRVSRKPRDGCGRRKNKGERATHSRRFCNGEDYLARSKRKCTDSEPNDERTDDAGALAICGECSGDADEKRRRVDGEREQQPTEEAADLIKKLDKDVKSGEVKVPVQDVKKITKKLESIIK